MTTISREMRAAIESAPEGTGGLVIEPWSAGEIYGVAADWAQAASPVYFYSCSGWEQRQYQVADFRHKKREALDCELRQAIIAGGGDEDDAADVLDDATEF